MNNFLHTAGKPLTLALAVITACAALATGARAGDVPQVHVRYADLNVDTDAGADALYRRIRAAANQVCALTDNRDLAALGETRVCVNRAIAEAVAAVKSPPLSQVHESKMDISPAAEVASLQ